MFKLENENIINIQKLKKMMADLGKGFIKR